MLRYAQLWEKKEVGILHVVRKMNIKKGIKLLEEREGEGPPAEKGDHVYYNLRAYLSKGEEIIVNERYRDIPEQFFTEDEKGLLINWSCVIGRRNAVAAVEYSLIGMKVGGYRKIKATPHLAYRDEGVPGKIPPKAVIIFEIWLKELNKKKNAQQFHPADPE